MNEKKYDKYDETKDIDLLKTVHNVIVDETWDRRMEAGQSK